MADAQETTDALAVLIDADNASPSIVEGLLAEVAKLGVANVKRIYGDWTTPNLGTWKDVLLQHSIQPIQQFRYTTGKNATDSAMIIDAMDLLYKGPFAGFCLVSSDSDFTRLASRIRDSVREGAGPQLRAVSVKELRGDTKLVSLFRSAIEAASDESGWAHLGRVGSNIVKQAPDFDPRNYGYSKLNELANAIGLFEIDRRDKTVLIRDSRKS